MKLEDHRMTVTRMIERLSELPGDLPCNVFTYVVGSNIDEQTYCVTHIEGLQDGDGNKSVVIWGARKRGGKD